MTACATLDAPTASPCGTDGLRLHSSPNRPMSQFAPQPPIPYRIHFIWLGSKLPFFARLAAQSALLRCPEAEVILWHTHVLDSDPEAAVLRDRPGFRMRLLDSTALFGSLDEAALPVRQLSRIWFELPDARAHANLARLLLLYRHGGIYLDTDTLTLRDLRGLLDRQAFCGLEELIWPRRARRSLGSYRLFWGPLLGRIRALSAWVPWTYRIHTRVRSAYVKAVNNAVLGSTPQHEALGWALREAAGLPPAEWQRPYRLGTHLLQQAVESDAGRAVDQLSPDAFFPLGPVISAQYFHRRRAPASWVNEHLPDTTYAVHWYASVSALNAYDASYVRRHADKSVFTYLCNQVLESS